MTETTIGVDISKGRLDAFCLRTGEGRCFSNTPKGHKQLIGWLTGRQVTRLVYEPTGPYHRAFELALSKAGIPLAKVNPRQARRFAEATGQLAKTDGLDAKLLARMGEALDPRLLTVASPALSALRELQAARQALIKDQTAAKNRLQQHSAPVLKRLTSRRLKAIARDIALVDREIQALISQDPTLARRQEILLSIPGIAAVTAQALLIDMPELGALDAKQAASLIGWAPMTRQSGAGKGRASIRGGRASVRQALYMPALVACRFNPNLKAKYQALLRARPESLDNRNIVCVDTRMAGRMWCLSRLSGQTLTAGKPPKVAIVAVMRKLVLLANALLKAGRSWMPKAARSTRIL